MKHDWHSETPQQAPKAIYSLYEGFRQIVYGFASDCMQATLSATFNGCPMTTTVTSSELQITHGSVLHALAARAIIRDWDEGLLG